MKIDRLLTLTVIPRIKSLILIPRIQFDANTVLLIYADRPKRDFKMKCHR